MSVIGADHKATLAAELRFRLDLNRTVSADSERAGRDRIDHQVTNSFQAKGGTLPFGVVLERRADRSKPCRTLYKNSSKSNVQQVLAVRNRFFFQCQVVEG